MQEVHLRRWEVVAAFLFNVIAIVVVTILLTNAIHSNHRLAQINHRITLANHRFAVQGLQAHAALCDLRSELAQRVPPNNTFLNALSDLKCK